MHGKLFPRLSHCAAAQARRPIRELAIVVLINGDCRLERFTPQDIVKDPEWPPRIYELPGTAVGASIANAGTLEVSKSEHQLIGRHKDQNTVGGC